MSIVLLCLIAQLVELPLERTPIGSKWVFQVKYNSDGSLQKYKGRLVAQGFSQRPRFDFTKTFSPVVKPTSIRLILSLAISKSWCIRQLDVNNAFLNGDLQEDVYLAQAQAYKVDNGSLVCKLTKALYGLKQAPRAWYRKLSTALQQLGFTPTKSDVSLFTRIVSSSTTFIVIYMDDIIVTGNSTSYIAELIQKLNSTFALKDMGDLHYFLDIQVKHTSSGGLLLSQAKYVQDLLQKAQMSSCKPCSTPLPSSLKLTTTDGIPFEDPSLY